MLAVFHDEACWEAHNARSPRRLRHSVSDEGYVRAFGQKEILKGG